MADAMRTLPDAELEVMQAIWACEEPVKRAAISAIWTGRTRWRRRRC